MSTKRQTTARLQLQTLIISAEKCLRAGMRGVDVSRKRKRDPKKKERNSEIMPRIRQATRLVIQLGILKW